jgi:hypothetical protein
MMVVTYHIPSEALDPRMALAETIRNLMLFDASLLVIEDEKIDAVFVRGSRRGTRIGEPDMIPGYSAIFGGRFLDYYNVIELLLKRKKRFSLYDMDDVLLGTFDPKALYVGLLEMI